MQHGYGGEAVSVVKRTRLTDDQVRRVRSRQMYLMRLQGTPTEEIAIFFSFTRQYINKEIAAIPDAEKGRIERSVNRVQVA